MSQTVPPYELSITVAEGDIDMMDHVNNLVYLRWVLRAATMHWRAAAPAGVQDKILWIVLRHEIDYKQPARLNDEIIVRTWVGQSRRLRFERHTEILRATGRVLLAKALTVWCPVDAATGRPAAVSDEVRAMFSTPD